MKATKIELRKGDSLKLLEELESDSIDLILIDPPYGTVKDIAKDSNLNFGMKNKTGWDTAICPKILFKHSERVLRENGTLLVCSQDPYSFDLLNKQHINLPFTYKYIWVKDHFANSLIAKKAPVNYYEEILCFVKKYDFNNKNPLRQYSKNILKFINKKSCKAVNDDLGHRKAEHFFYIESTQFKLCTEIVYEELTNYYNLNEMQDYKSFEELKELNFKFSRIFNLENGKKIKSNVLNYKKDYLGHHPTQKPVALFEDLIKTYSNDGDLVLDMFAGSGTTGVACQNLNRNCIMIEKEEEYCNIILERLKYNQ